MTYDLIAVGGGLAGLVAANRAAQLGGRAVALEALTDRKHQSASRLSGGVFHVAYRSVMAPPDELAAGVAASTAGFVAPPLAAALADNAARAIRWLQSMGADFTGMTPDQGWKDWILAPLGFHDHTRVVWEGYGADILMDRLEATLIAAGGSVLRGRRARRLLLEDGHCRGVVADGPAGVERYEGAAVVLADGGFHGNPEMLRRHVSRHPEHLKLRGPDAGRGDGIAMAEAAGAALTGMDFFYGHLLSADALTRDNLSPFPFIDFLASAGVLVDAEGRRFVDEGGGGIYMANHLARHGSGLAAAIFDEAIWQNAGREFFCPPNPNLVEAGGTLHRADDLDGLARAAGLPAEALAQTIARYNAAVDAGTVAGLAPTRSTWKYAAVAIRQAPFYAAPACAAITHTMGGVAVDAAARVLNAQGAPIGGLYAAGTTCGGLEGGRPVGYVGGLIKAAVFGLLAAETNAGGA